MSILLRRAPLALLVGSLALGVVGCGSEQAGDSGASVPKTKVTDTPSSSPSDESGSQDAPTVVLHRTGGVAGFMDTLTVKPDGQAVLSGRGRQDLTCSVKAGTLDTITTAASRVQAEGPHTKTSPTGKKTFASPMPDQMHFTLELGDTTIRYTDTAKSDQETRSLFKAMGEVLTSAAAMRNGEKPDGDVVCG